MVWAVLSDLGHFFLVPMNLSPFLKYLFNSGLPLGGGGATRTGGGGGGGAAAALVGEESRGG